jgi:hypothetical protein
VRPLLVGRKGPWPLAGHLRGRTEHGGVSLAWAGRVAGTDPLAGAWRAAGVLHRALSQAGAPLVDRRRAIASGWERVGRPDGAELGSLHGAGLVLLLIARDADGLAVSGVGLGGLFACSGTHVVRNWLEAPHPLLGPTGRPVGRPGALMVDSGPDWLVGVAHGEPSVAGLPAAAVLARAGVDLGTGARGAA